MQYPILLLLVVVFLAAFSQAEDSSLPETFTCKGGANGKAHTFTSKDCVREIDGSTFAFRAAEFLAKGKSATASCNDCLLALVGSDKKPFTPTKPLNKDAIIASLKTIVDGCTKQQSHQKRDDKQPQVAVILGLSTDKKCSA
ncbi:hypothetical protein VP01_1824g8 [Puccinia sorghi]|uniref:Uncharacterized protein n=1 Tax=Puccinia sorghi TaxID=27349 RepID=A0A0L6VDX5_9BASI|nr:hypothetical protein VP01_1824g8 [Puccinia sorghi]